MKRSRDEEERYGVTCERRRRGDYIMYTRNRQCCLRFQNFTLIVKKKKNDIVDDDYDDDQPKQSEQGLETASKLFE